MGSRLFCFLVSLLLDSRLAAFQLKCKRGLPSEATRLVGPGMLAAWRKLVSVQGGPRVQAPWPGLDCKQVSRKQQASLHQPGPNPPTHKITWAKSLGERKLGRLVTRGRGAEQGKPSPGSECPLPPKTSQRVSTQHSSAAVLPRSRSPRESSGSISEQNWSCEPAATRPAARGWDHRSLGCVLPDGPHLLRPPFLEGGGE